MAKNFILESLSENYTAVAEYILIKACFACVIAL
ncbi:hypothetical protein T4B_3736 [Trichinella pseudospiralis]|uniref:Uncharacterized protein n=1 Tax=Trichinella pseudospiralis TaxID=6337 RepID=A0A0V1GHP3_TRIPS|nr:hypothetical protein T4B_3736 [Trichinella pseudospiralis]